ncbi:hypothetical protein L1887_47431 [Cichorium endivia]|nr:hypothetical protein L1887_47431 [Cichorium endivia]
MVFWKQRRSTKAGKLERQQLSFQKFAAQWEGKFGSRHPESSAPFVVERVVKLHTRQHVTYDHNATLA